MRCDQGRREHEKSWWELKILWWHQVSPWVWCCWTCCSRSWLGWFQWEPVSTTQASGGSLWDLSMSVLPHLEIALISFFVPLHSLSDLNKKDIHTPSYLLRSSFRPRNIEGCLKYKHLSETKIWDTPTLPNNPVLFCVFICYICKTSIQAFSWCSGLHIWVLSFDFR